MIGENYNAIAVKKLAKSPGVISLLIALLAAVYKMIAAASEVTSWANGATAAADEANLS